MAYFPLFIDLEAQPILIVGGGRMALDKARKLADYGPRLTVIATEICPELARMRGVEPIRRAFAPEDIRAEYILVIAATNDNAVNREVAALCRRRRIPVNVVDTQEECSFLFPALIRRGPLSIGVSTGGASPAAAVLIKNGIDRALPDAAEDILLWLRSVRGHIRESIRTQAQRKSLYQTLLTEAVRLGRPLTDEETEKRLSCCVQSAEEVPD